MRDAHRLGGLGRAVHRADPASGRAHRTRAASPRGEAAALVRADARRAREEREDAAEARESDIDKAICGLAAAEIKHLTCEVCGQASLGGHVVYARAVARLRREHAFARAAFIAAGRPVPSWVLA